MNGEQPYVSVVEPLSPAIDWMKTVLFRPFDLGKWFVIGFCAWLAQLAGQGGGGGSRGGGQAGKSFRNGGSGFDGVMQEAREGLAAAREFVEANLIWIIPLAILAVAIVVGLWLLFAWLSSRGRFMFLHCVAENKGEVVVPWHKFSQHGDSLFVFRIILGLIGFAIVAAGLLAASSFLIEAATATKGEVVHAILTVIAVIFGIFLISIPLLIVKKFTTDFVVPIMFVQTASCTAAWRQFLTVLSANKMRFFLYLLFQIVIGFIVGILVLAAVCVTCCCAGCIFAIPYIGTVAMLPVLVFTRSYSVCYLRQYGPAFDVFRAERQDVAPG